MELSRRTRLVLRQRRIKFAVYAIALCASILLAYRQSPFWYSPLTRAAMRGDADRVDRLIQSGASVNRRSSMFGTDAFTNWTPLHWAAYRNHEDVVANLLKCGADASAADRFGRSALCIAITGLAPDKRLETVRALLNGRANPNQPNNFGTTPLHLAALSDDAAIVRLLIATGAQVNAKDRDGTTPLHHAVLDRKNPHTTRLLLEHGAETGDPLPNGRTLESVLDPDEHGSELIDVVRQAQQRN